MLIIDVYSERVRKFGNRVLRAERLLHLCTELKLKAMKKSVSMLASLVMMVIQLWAQSTPNDLHITGYVTDANGAAVDDHLVCVIYSGENPNIPDSLCATTNPNGWYSIVVTYGSMTGPNQTFTVSTWSVCQNTWSVLNEDVSNQQGTVDAVQVDFALSCNSGGGGCNCEAQIVSTLSPNGDVHMFAVDIPCGTAPFQYQWWIDGHVITGATATYQFTQDGIYGVGVTLSDANGCSFTAWDTVFVGNTSCTAYWYYNSNPNGGIAAGIDNHFWFSGSASNASSFFWSVTGGGLSLISNQMNPIFNFPNAGNYEVCLSVIDSLTMCEAEYCAPVTVVGNNTGSCQAFFVPTDSSGYHYFLNYSQGTNLNYHWDFGDGHNSNSTHPWHQYAQEGAYAVCLTVTGLNCQTFYCDTVVVSTQSPDSCDAYFFSSGPTPIGYTFSAALQSNLYNYTWTVDNQWMPNNGTELYVPGFTEGVHTVCLTVSSNNLCSDTYCATIVIGQDSVCQGFVSGQVFAGTLNHPIDIAIVYLISYDDQTGQLAAMQATVTDSGYYYFQSVPCGEYLIKAATTPNSSYYSNHLPTYYGNSLFWEYAQEVVVNATMPTVQYDIVLIAGNNPGGPGFIGGNVLQGANKVEADGEPLEGINVMLFDLAGNAIAYTYTNVNGEFSFDGLAYGGYQVYAEMLNYTTIPAVVNISAEEPMVEGLNIFVSENLISTGISETDFESLIGNIYPNPASDVAMLSINLDEAYAVNVMVVDLTGRTISSKAVNLLPGINTHQLSVEGLGSGYYMLSIRDVRGAFNVTRRFIVNR